MLQDKQLEAAVLFHKAQQNFSQISMKQISQAASFPSKIPPSAIFVIKVFIAMINDIALDEAYGFYKISDPSQPKVIDQTKLFFELKNISVDCMSKKYENVVNLFDPKKMSEHTLKYLQRVKKQSLQGPEPEFTEEKIHKTSSFVSRLWNWCQCMLKINEILLQK